MRRLFRQGKSLKNSGCHNVARRLRPDIQTTRPARYVPPGSAGSAVILDKLRWLADNCDTVSHDALRGRQRGSSRERIGDYRAIYNLDRTNRRIVVHKVGHRSEIYD